MTKRREEISLFHEKNLKRAKTVKLLSLFLQLPLSIGLVLTLTKMDEFLSKLVPSTEEWTLVIMLIPLTLFGIYVSLFSSNLHSNKDKTICGESYAKIKSRYITDSWILNTFKYNTLTATIGFVMYIITSDYPMIIGSGLVLSLDLFIFVSLELCFTQKSTTELYQREFDIFFKAIKEIIYFSQDELANIETMIKSGDWSGVSNLISSKLDISEYVDEMCYEFENYSPTLSRDISIRFAKTFSFKPTHIENHLLYKHYIDQMLVLAQKMRQKGNERCADEMLISLGERWIDIIGTFFVFESKNTKSNTKKFKEFKAFLEALKESMRFRLLHNILLEEYKVLSNAMMEVHCFPKRCEQFKTTSKIIADGLVAVNNSHDEFLKQIETDCTKN